MALLQLINLQLVTFAISVAELIIMAYVAEIGAVVFKSWKVQLSIVAPFVVTVPELVIVQPLSVDVLARAALNISDSVQP